MNTYLAKSNPQETIQEHTENLIRNYEIIRSIYPKLAINWEILYHACLLHDLGKMNNKFQYKIKTGKKVEDEIPHGILSLAFVNTKELKSQGFTKDEIRILAHSIAYHHERDLSYNTADLEEAIELLKEEINYFSYKKLPKLEVKKLSARYFAKNRIYEQDDEKVFYSYIIIKGLLNRIDYAASAYIDVEVKNDFLMCSLKSLMVRWQKKTFKYELERITKIYVKK